MRPACFFPRPCARATRAFLITLALLTAPGLASADANPAASSSATPAAAPIPALAFFDNPAMRAAKLSPDGKFLAAVVKGATGYDRLGVVDLSDNAMKVVAQFNEADVGRFQWVNNNRLLYDSGNKDTAPGDQRYAPGLFAVNRDGSGRRQLVQVAGQPFLSEAPLGVEKLPWTTYMLDQPGAQDSDHVYVVTAEFGSDRNVSLLDLVRLDTVSGRSETVKRPGMTLEWWLDAKGQPALASTREGNLSHLHYLDPKDGRWRKLASFDAFLGGEDAFTPLGFTPQGQLYVVSNKGQDKRGLYAYDLATGKLADQALVDSQEFDFSGGLVTDAKTLLGVRYTADSEGVAWFDPAMKAAQAAVDKLLPNRVNQLEAPLRAQTPYLLVRSWSDRQPPSFLLYNRDSGQLRKIGATHPAIEPARMAGQELVRIKARDGLPIPTWLTIPSNSAGRKLPMVVLVHGGPFLRGHEWEWDAESQFLASRGYLVLQPEFRGSRGYGAKHFRAGWKQWGLAMQDDIADAARWAIAEGIADPKRICIAGASYGGYATLMGLIRDPDLYRCGINWVGVTDINLMYTGHWSRHSDLSDAWKRHGMPALVGDPVKDAAQLAATSPLLQAAKITQPLLMAYGGADERVPIYHGRKFHEAVKAGNKEVEMVEYQQEGHGWTLVKTRLDFWERVEKFLQKNIGTP